MTAHTEYSLTPKWLSKSAKALAVASIAAIFCVTLFVAVLVPSFGGPGPFVLGLVAAVLAPLGPLVASIILGDRDARAPALRRIDSLLLLAPVWAWVAAALLH